MATELINNLINTPETETCITIALNTHRFNNDAQQDPLRFKKMVQEAAVKLEENGYNTSEAEELLDDISKLKDKHKFWLKQQESLIVFAGNGLFEYQKLPFKISEQVYVSDHFYIKPLIDLQQRMGEYFVLTLSKNNIRLLKIDHTVTSEIALEDIPTSYEEFTKFDVYEKSLSSSSTGSGNKQYHGTGDAAADDERYIEEFMKQVESGVTSYMRKTNRPLLLAGVDRIRSKYRKVNHYDHVITDNALKGNPDKWSEKELAEKSQPVIEQEKMGEIRREAEKCADYTNTDRFVRDIKQVSKAAGYGQIDTLFIAKNGAQPGYFDSKNEEVVTDGKASTDLYNWTGVKVLQNSGTVYLLDKEDMPDNAAFCALLRYSTSA